MPEFLEWWCGALQLYSTRNPPPTSWASVLTGTSGSSWSSAPEPLRRTFFLRRAYLYTAQSIYPSPEGSQANASTSQLGGWLCGYTRLSLNCTLNSYTFHWIYILRQLRRLKNYPLLIPYTTCLNLSECLTIKIRYRNGAGGVPGGSVT